MGDGREPIFIKAKSSAYTVEVAHSTLNMLGYDFVNIHNAFRFDLKHLAAVPAELDSVTDLFKKKRLGNFGSGTFMRLKYGYIYGLDVHRDEDVQAWRVFLVHLRAYS